MIAHSRRRQSLFWTTVGETIAIFAFLAVIGFLLIVTGPQ